jgi:hypothetical protein
MPIEWAGERLHMRTFTTTLGLTLIVAALFATFSVVNPHVAEAAGGGAERVVIPISDEYCWEGECTQEEGELVLIMTPSENMLFLLRINRTVIRDGEVVGTGTVKVRTLSKPGTQHMSHEMSSSTDENGCTVKYMAQWNHDDITFMRDFDNCD